MSQLSTPVEISAFRRSKIPHLAEMKVYAGRSAATTMMGVCWPLPPTMPASSDDAPADAPEGAPVEVQVGAIPAASLLYAPLQSAPAAICDCASAGSSVPPSSFESGTWTANCDCAVRSSSVPITPMKSAPCTPNLRLRDIPGKSVQRGRHTKRLHRPLDRLPGQYLRIPVDVGSDSAGMWAPKTL